MRSWVWGAWSVCLKGTEGLPATALISLKAKVIGYLLGTRSVACEVTGNSISKTEVGAYRLTLFWMLSCSIFLQGGECWFHACIEFKLIFLYVSSLKHICLTLMIDDPHNLFKNPVIFSTGNMLNADKLLPVGVCTLLSNWFIIFSRISGTLQIDWINPMRECSVCYRKAQTVGLKLKNCFFFLFLSAYYPTPTPHPQDFPQFPFVCKDEPPLSKPFFYWLTFSHRRRLLVSWLCF